MPITDNAPDFQAMVSSRGFHARITRAGRGRAVLAQRRHRLRKRCAAIAAAMALPAMAGATNWATPASREASSSVEATAYGTKSADGPLAGTPMAPAIGQSAASRLVDQATSPGPAARAFLSSGSWLDRARAEQCLTMAIYYEAATEPDDGQRAVAQVVLNRVAHPSFPKTVCGVVFQGSERSTGCQFTFACDGSLIRKPVPYWWARARRVAEEALAGAVYAPVGLATHYHTLDVHPAWDNAMQRVITIGAHEFFRLPGPAGERAAFHIAYLGGEPMAAPHAKTSTPAPSSDDDPLMLARAYVAALASSSPSPEMRSQASGTTTPKSQPAHSVAVQARGGDAQFTGSNLPDGGTLSPELQRSGQWLDRP